ncbi:hypothetical protein [Actinomadura rugatobispora]|uniref:Uncharacterized protein n=1 Tax=Actinomadura rugatobispora TaxID=1994 RepID=A0ABW1A694_9ACTN
MADSDQSKMGVLEVGASGRFEGVYYSHWEWNGLKIVRRSRWRRRVTWCQVESEEVPWPDLIEDDRVARGRNKGARFAVVFDATVVERGSFGHRGGFTWRLSVQRWVSVERIS